jgi:hypothetical protein
MPTQPSATEIIHCMLQEPPQQQIAYLQQWPPNPYLPIAIRFVELTQPLSAVAALDALCLGYHDREHAPLLLQIGEAIQHLSLVSVAGKTGGDAQEYAAKATCWQMKAYLQLGRLDAAIALGDANLPKLQSTGTLPIFYRIELYAIEAFLLKGDLETARSRYEQVKNAITAPEDIIQLNSIKDNLHRLLQSATTVASEHKAPTASDTNRHLMEQLAAIAQQHQNNPDTLSALQHVQAALAENQTALESGLNIHEAHREASKAVYEQFSQVFGHSLVHELQQQSQEAWMVFHDPAKAHDPVHLRQALGELQAICQRVENAQISYDLKTVWWSIAVIYNRLKMPREGLNYLEHLWAVLEQERLQIADYHERAGIFYQFEFLFGSLCNFYELLNDSAGLLQAIESSKGRVLADTLDRQNGQGVAIAQLTNLITELPSLLAREQANYLTFMMDDDDGFAVLMNERGQLFHQRLPFGESPITTMASGAIA